MKVPGWLYPSVMVVMSVFMIMTYLNFKKQRDALKRNVAALEIALEKTVEVAPGVFERGTVEARVSDLKGVGEDLKELSDRLDSLNRRALAVTEILLTQKKSEGRAPAKQTTVKVEDPKTGAVVERKRVDFSMDLSYYRVSGHTVSDPPESYLVLEQVRPMPLLVAISRGDDGRWVTNVKTDEGVKADIKLSVVDKKTVTGGWRQNISLGLAAGFVPEPSVSVNALYGERFALGPFCSVSTNSSSCGLMASWRPFAR